MPYTQDNRTAAVSTPLGKDKLLLKSIVGEEAISQPFNYMVQMLSEDGDIKFEDLIGETLTIRLNHMDGGKKRYFNGLVADLRQSEPFSGLHSYQAQVVPWFWFLKKSANCRIFRLKTVPDILIAVFKAYGFEDFKKSLSATYPKLEHCVQYHETDFAFASRLMEEVGIYYFFTHEDGKHTMVLADSKAAHDPCPDFGTVKYVGSEANSITPNEIHRWEQGKQSVSGAFALTDFNFAKPKKKLAPEAKDEKKHSHADFEQYTYEGEFIEDGGKAPDTATEFEDLAKIRLAALQVEHTVAYADSDCRGLQVGHTFKLTDCYRKDQNSGYLITAISHQIEIDGYTSGGGGMDKPYTCTISAIPDTIQYRPARLTPKSRVAGPQTATVVGKDGEEIETDKYGRVKVHFHWDRDKDRSKIEDTEGQKPENRSCWVRVSQNWAGKKYGTVFLPRIGQEVVVDFLEGDPDRPIITGRVYNGDLMPPYELPTHKTISTIKSNSSKGGVGFNEVRFEDKKDSEQIFIHAEKDTDIRVLNDHREAVMGNMDLRIGEGEKGAGDVGNRTAWIQLNDQLIVLKDRMEKIEGSHHELTVGDNFQKTDGAQHLTIAGDENIKVTGKISRDAGGDIHEKSGGNYAMDATSSIHIKAGTKIILEASTQISLKVGGNFIDIGTAGVDIKGTLVNINSGGAAGSGGGSSPTAPTEPTAPVEAVKAKEAEKSIDDQPIKFSE